MPYPVAERADVIVGQKAPRGGNKKNVLPQHVSAHRHEVRAQQVTHHLRIARWSAARESVQRVDDLQIEAGIARVLGGELIEPGREMGIRIVVATENGKQGLLLESNVIGPASPDRGKGELRELGRRIVGKPVGDVLKQVAEIQPQRVILVEESEGIDYPAAWRRRMLCYRVAQWLGLPARR